LEWPGTVHVLAGGQWTTLPPTGMAYSFDVIVTGAGTIVAACASSQTPAVRWDGQAWQPMGSGLMPVGRLELDSAGELLLMGKYYPGGVIILVGGSGPHVILAWTGSQWVVRTQLNASGAIFDLLALPDGDLVAVGNFGVGMNRWGIARWRAGWLQVDGSLSLPMAPELVAKSIAMTRDGEVFVAGNFARAGNVVSARLAKATTNCPAVVTAVGSGCVGAAGPVQLEALDRPWLGATFHAEGTGFASAALAIHAIGDPAAATALPLAAPGCTVYLAPLVTELLVPAAGAVGTDLAVPLQPSLVGVAFRMQLFGVEISGAALQLTSSNALDFVVGAL
jgi:hypothetical protein